ncbi:MAG: hypothetical protein E7305_02015 [Butyrivibrio sp.]|nr:hypothetical protein [Butyrivibrio sp.]
MDITALMLAERERIEGELQKELFEFEQSKYPEGRLKTMKNGNYYKYYQAVNTSSGVKWKYIKKDNQKLARTLAMKAYKKRTIYGLEREIKAIDAYLELYPKQTADALIREAPGFKTLLESEIIPEFDCKDWELEEYERSTNHPEQLDCPTLKGPLVRSKSEAAIADELYRRGIPYRYEWVREFGGRILSPDFTIMDPKTLKIYIWEHYGKMDDPDYIEKYLSKMQTYTRNGYIETMNLICTYETLSCPFTSVNAVEVIEKYFVRHY